MTEGIPETRVRTEYWVKEIVGLNSIAETVAIFNSLSQAERWAKEEYGADYHGVGSPFGERTGAFTLKVIRHE